MGKDDKGELYKTDNYALAQTTNKVATDNLMPKVYGGLGTSVQLYGFDASIQLSYQLGGQIYDSGYRFMMAGKVTDRTGTRIFTMHGLRKINIRMYLV